MDAGADSAISTTLLPNIIGDDLVLTWCDERTNEQLNTPIDGKNIEKFERLAVAA